MNIKKIKSQLSEARLREERIRFRIKVVVVGVGFAFLVVVARAIQLHCGSNESLGWIASKQYNAVFQQSARRGRILDRNGRELAVSLPVQSIYSDTRMITDAEETAKKVAAALSLEVKDVTAKLKSQKKFVWLKRRASSDETSAIHDLPGIYTVEESRRSYPNGDLASQLLGAVGFDSDPLAGVELAFNKFLASQHVSAAYKKDARGKFYFSPTSYHEQDDIADVFLTIDKQVQFVAESALKKGVEASHAKGGTAIVMDVATGAILAMANAPIFDPNNYSKYDQSAWRNRAITDTVEPGSTFKALIVASALDAGVVQPESVFNCENGAVKVGNAVLHDHDPYGNLSVADIIKVSSNIGALKVAREAGREKIFDTLRKFGIGNKTGLDFPGEVSGLVRNPSNLQPVEYATIAFGQGIGVTPLQMATAFASIANGGKLMRPYLVDRVVNNQGIPILETHPEVVSTPIGPSTAATMVGLLQRVVEQGGTGTKAATPEYQVAGKTGTAQKVSEGAGRYSAGKYYASFIGFAPLDVPRVAVFIGIDEPIGAYYGGVVAAPIFREVVEKALKHLAVPSTLSRIVEADTLPGMVISPIARKRFVKIDSEAFEVPNLYGSTMRDVLETVGKANIKLKLEGTGLAVLQEPQPGSIVKAGEIFRVSFRQPD